MKYVFTFSEDKHGLCQPQCVLYCVLLAAKSIKPMKFNRRLGKTVNFLFSLCFINIFFTYYCACAITVHFNTFKGEASFKTTALNYRYINAFPKC